MSSIKNIPLQAAYGIRLLEHLQQHGSVPFDGLATKLDIPYGQMVAVFTRFKAMCVVNSSRQFFNRKQKYHWALNNNADVDGIMHILRREAGNVLHEAGKPTEKQIFHEDAENLPTAIWDQFLRGKI